MTDELNVPEKMTCEEFQAHMPELIASGEDISQHPHILECELCRALLADLEAIAAAAREMFQPVEDPPDNLWEQIQSKIRAEGPGGIAAASELEANGPEIEEENPAKRK
jgi:hypothetical protein